MSTHSTPEPGPGAETEVQYPQRKKGRPVAYEWTEKWTCDHSGSYRDQRKANLSPSKRRIHRTHESIKVGCKAYIWFRKRPEKSEIEIEYGWQHTGHTPLSLKDMRDSMMSDRVRDWVNSRVDEGLDWRAMKDLLRIEVEANKQLRASAKADFTRFIHAATSDDFEDVWQEIQVTYMEHTVWMAYLRTEWMGKKERWPLAWRKVRDWCHAPVYLE